MVYLWVFLFVHLCRVSDGIQAKSMSQKRNQDMATKSGFKSVSMKYAFIRSIADTYLIKSDFCINVHSRTQGPSPTV